MPGCRTPLLVPPPPPQHHPDTPRPPRPTCPDPRGVALRARPPRAPGDTRSPAALPGCGTISCLTGTSRVTLQSLSVSPLTHERCCPMSNPHLCCTGWSFPVSSPCSCSSCQPWRVPRCVPVRAPAPGTAGTCPTSPSDPLWASIPGSSPAPAVVGAAPPGRLLPPEAPRELLWGGMWGRAVQGVSGARFGVLWHGVQLETNPRWGESVAAGRKPGAPGANPVLGARQQHIPCSTERQNHRDWNKTSQVMVSNLQLTHFPGSPCPAGHGVLAEGRAGAHSTIQTPPCSQGHGNPAQMPRFEMQEASQERQQQYL